MIKIYAICKLTFHEWMNKTHPDNRFTQTEMQMCMAWVHGIPMAPLLNDVEPTRRDELLGFVNAYKMGNGK